ncbi:luciferase [Actinoplanes sp. NBRC 14428]|uniref:Putative LLM family oxidoreductase n=1 Tax=Pseudosporangium ferrugineum TaxID=439699 RepID=A0A2T0SFL6_9ACTN|nr:LLM class flavin-dependent oxidoreductase [Pseudosporangium ferrugineum]PRY32208.1 putative LLM family oxidoreductase [Pseudosporangium ferrugineum]BCJ49547.1 luciferase [Actinoplanes sp. NBRC 14428]
MEIGAFTFADVSVRGGVAAPQRIPELIEEIVLADEVGLDVFGLGEHHHPAFGAPAPPVTLAAAAARTSRIRLTSAVTVLSTADPVRVLEEFHALDLVSGGRAELMVGRGALLDSFRLFGHDLQDYEQLFDEKLRLLLRLREGGPVTWSGRFRPPLHGETVLPRPVQDPLPVSVAVGGSPQSAVRAAAVGLPLMIGTLGGQAHQLAPIAELYREALGHYGKERLPIGMSLHGFVADTSQRAGEIYFPADAELRNVVGARLGVREVTAEHMAAQNGPGSTYAVGSPQQVIEKILHYHEVLGHQRTMLQLAVGPVPHRDLMRAIELLGTEVAPVVRAEVARREAVAPVGEAA